MNNQQYIADHENRMRPSSWLRLQQMRMQLGFCEQHGAQADFYHLPELPKELLDRLDSIEPEHMGPIAEEIGEVSTRGDDGSLEPYDSMPHRLFVELQRYRFLRVQEFSGGVGFLLLYACAEKPNVLYLVETDGESGVWCGTRFGHYIDNCNE